MSRLLWKSSDSKRPSDTQTESHHQKMYAAPSSSDGLPEKGSSWLPDEALWAGGRESRPQYQTQDLSRLPSFFKSFLNLNSLQYCFHFILVFWPWGICDLGSPTRDQTHTPCIGRQSLNHWTTREVPLGSLLQTPQSLGESCDCYLCWPPAYLTVCPVSYTPFQPDSEPSNLSRAKLTWFLSQRSLGEYFLRF